MGKKDVLLIADWKFIGEIKYQNIWNNAFFPIQHLPDTNYYKYILQLNLYKYIIKREGYFPEYKNYKLEIFHVKEDGLEVISVPDNVINIKQMIAHYEKDKIRE